MLKIHQFNEVITTEKKLKQLTKPRGLWVNGNGRTLSVLYTRRFGRYWFVGTHHPTLPALVLSVPVICLVGVMFTLTALRPHNIIIACLVQ